MENAAETLNDVHADEKIKRENGISDEKFDDGVAVTSHESKMNEGEEVFEEAIESQDHVPEEDLKLDTAVSIVSGPDGNVAVAIASSEPVMLTEDSSFVNEAENFLEVIGIPGEVVSRERSSRK